MPAPHALLDLPPFPADRYGPLADRLKALLGTRNDVVFVQAEAILALEAAATSLGRPGLVAVNIVTSPYGGYFGHWLRRAGALVHEIVAEAGQPVTLEAVERTLGNLPRVDLLAVVHAETSSGILNPLPGIAAAAKARGALLVVDAVASVGGHPLDVDALGIDICIIGPQKALGGPAGLSVVAIGPEAWQEMRKKPPERPYVPSSLSLSDSKANWLDKGRGAPPGMPSALEFWALDAALTRVEAEGLSALIARHERAARATRTGLVALGVAPWIADDAAASTLATAAPVPPGTDPAALIEIARRFGAHLSPGFGAVSQSLVRLDHTGQRAGFTTVLANVVGYGAALAQLGLAIDTDAATAAIVEAYA